MNHATLRKIAAATAIICDENGGSVDMFFAIKAIYLSDRQTLVDYGFPITGDRYSSMPKGPILCATYDLMAGKYSKDHSSQSIWNEAFQKTGNSIKPKGKIDVDCLAPAEEAILRDKIRLIKELDAHGRSIADWMHENCPEWERVPVRTSKPLPLHRLISFAKNLDPQKAKELEEAIGDGLRNRDEGVFAKQPLLVSC